MGSACGTHVRYPGSACGCRGSNQDVIDPSTLRKQFTEVSPDLFKQPAAPTGRSGGSAAFYAVELARPETAANPKEAGAVPDLGRFHVEPQGPHFWIGKDLSRAMDEVDFYETARELGNAAEAEADESFQVLRWLVEYGGVVSLQVGTETENRKEQILLLRNLRDGKQVCRFLDIKIGDVTAVAGWKKKSGFGALKQEQIDFFTNTAKEGFRLEGFDHPPWSFKSVLELNRRVLGVASKKTNRIQMQNLEAKEFLSYFLDLREASDNGQPNACDHAEYAEIVSASVVAQLTLFALDCEAMTTP